MTLLGSQHSTLIRSKFRSVLQFRLQQRTRQQLDHSIMPLNDGNPVKVDDSFAFDDDSSSGSVSPEQHHSDESQGSACPSSEALGSTASSSSPPPPLTSPRQGGVARELPDHGLDEGSSSAHPGQAAHPMALPAIVKAKNSDKNRHKKPKDVKPKVKKLKYHQYIPPDQKAEKSPPPMDSAYARLLQQQQLFLQLQILSQQKQSQTHPQAMHQQPQSHLQQPAFSYHAHQSAHHRGAGDQLSACPSSCPSSNSSSPVKSSFSTPSSVSPVKSGPLPANLDDLKVSELRQHLRIRGMPVSGTKTALIERLRPFKDSNAGSSPSSCSDITTVTFPVTPTGSLSSYQSPSSSSALSHGGYYPYPSTSSTPPISPASSELSLSGSLPDSFSDVPMSSPTRFALQRSPAQLGVDGPDAEKDKMLVEKQKVIEELTWKLHQEQRQVEELKMQLHKRKRCYGALQDTGLPPVHPSMPHHQDHHHQDQHHQDQHHQDQHHLDQHHKDQHHQDQHHLDQHHQDQHHQDQHHQQQPSTAMMAQHFFGVTIKQEPVSFPPNCPLSSPKHLKSPPDSCMDDMGHCIMGGPSGPHGMEAVPVSGSPSTMSAFLSPQCSPQDSPIGKASCSPRAASPNSPYLLPLPMGRDGCSHPNNQGSNVARAMQQVQHKGGIPPLTCSYDHRNLQEVFPSAANCGLVHGGSSKPDPHNMHPKMSVVQLSRPHVDQKWPGPPPAFSSSDSDASDLRQPPPCYEEAVKQQLSRSQQMDELLDVLIESGGCPGLLIPRFQRHYEQLAPTQLAPTQLTYNPVALHGAEGHLENLLGGAPGVRPGDGTHLKMNADDAVQENNRNREEGYDSLAPPTPSRLPHHPQHDKPLTNRELIDTPLSPVGGKAPFEGMVSMAFSDTPWETMEWLDLTPPSSAPGFGVAPPTAPSIFNTEFLDVTDINLNSAMDLHLEHW